MIYAGKILGFWINVCDSMSSFARRLDISSELAFVTSFTSLRVPNLFILNLFHMALAFTSECITFTKMSRDLPVCNLRGLIAAFCFGKYILVNQATETNENNDIHFLVYQFLIV